MEVNLLDVVIKFKAGLIAKATDGEYRNEEFQEALRILNEDKRIVKMLPSLIKSAYTSDDFRRLMQSEFSNYRARRNYIDKEMAPIIEYIENINNGVDDFSEEIMYELGEKLGEGGFGSVYRYNHKLLDYDFAIKLFEPIFVSDTENIEGETRFFREAKILFQLNHKNIIRVFDIGRRYGQPFIRTELIDGYNLQEFQDKFGTVSFKRSLKPIKAILEGLKYAHDKGIIHRDLKPTNIMITSDNDFKIIDFGISTFVEDSKYTQLTKTGQSLVGGAYSDPTLINNPKLRDVRSDIYSLGAIWFYLIVGSAPAGANVRETLLNANEITALQAELILKCLSSDIKERYNSCDKILSEIVFEPNTNIYNNNVENTNCTSQAKW